MRPWLLMFVLLGCSGSQLPKGDPLSGEWNGTWARDGDTILVRQHFTRTDSGYTGHFSSDALRVVEIPFNGISLNGDSATWSLVGDESTSAFAGSVHSGVLRGSFTESNARGVFHFVRTPTRSTPGLKDISFRSGSAQLSGTVLLPVGEGPFPGIVFIHGSGAEGRWASRYLAQAFAEAGVAALIFDKRGVGSSTGDLHTATFDTLVQDALAAVRALRSITGIAADRVGVHGHSQGGTLMPMIAEHDSTLAFVVASAPSGMPADSVERYSVLNYLGADSMVPTERSLAVAFVDAIVATAYHDEPYANAQAAYRKVADRSWVFELPPPDDPYWTFSSSTGRYDPLEHWRRVRVPALVVAGEKDERVPTHPSVERIRSAYEQHSERTLRTLLFPGADHTFRIRSPGSVWPRSAQGYPDKLVQQVMEMLAIHR